ncbi:MAG: methionyl-tRNA formyltransferase [Tardiphaga sp.]|nr:methionyl-tRNA formyltransferase [Tardiphaga sp.]
MFNTIILLTGPAEHSIFTTLLRAHNPELTVLPAFTEADLVAIEPEWLARARLIAFNTPVIVPKHALEQLGYGAYNFHPGSPQYPGRAPAHMALAERAADFGATVHRMVEQVGAGPIVDVELFAIPSDITVAGLEEEAYSKLIQMFWRLAGVLATQQEPLVQRALRWGDRQNFGRAYRKNGNILHPIPPDQLPHIEMFGADHLGIVPSIELPGFRFPAEVPEAEAAEA